MPSALEIYYRNKAKGKTTGDKVKEMAANEFVGLPIKKKNPGFFHKLLDILDRPGNATRALLIGKIGGLKGLIPFAQSLENLTGIDFALNKDQLITGTEVIEKWFGKQKQKKGKIDPVDILGFMVEVVADPLWLIGIGGLTKTGKAAKLVQSSLKGAKGNAEAIKVLKTMIKAAKSGKKVGDGGRLAKAYKLIYGAGKRPTLAKTWAKQAALGQRAAFKYAGKPLIKGEKLLGGAEKLSTALKKSKLGETFLATTRRVPTEYKELHDIYTHFGRDLPHLERTKYFDKLEKLYTKGSKSGMSAEQMDKTVRQYIQRAYAKEGGDRFVEMTLAKRASIAEKQIKKLTPRLEKAKKKLAGKKTAYETAGVLPEREAPLLHRVPRTSEIGYVPKIEGFSRRPPKYKKVAEKIRELKTPTARRVAQAYEKRVAKLQNRLSKLKATGTAKDKKQILKLETKIHSLQSKWLIDFIKGQNRLALRKHGKMIAADKARAARRQAWFRAQVKQAEKEVGVLEHRMTHQKLFAKGLKKEEGQLVPITAVRKTKEAVANRDENCWPAYPLNRLRLLKK